MGLKRSRKVQGDLCFVPLWSGALALELKAAKGKAFVFRCVSDSKRNIPDKKRGNGLDVRKGVSKGENLRRKGNASLLKVFLVSLPFVVFPFCKTLTFIPVP